jgi:uncharacterized protein YndB with AHSA1/START domain
MIVEVADAVQAVTRQVVTREREGREAKVVLAVRSYDAQIDDVWDALTSPERLPRWFLPVSGDLRVGGRYQFEGNAGGVVERCEEPSLVAVTWEYGGEISWLVVRLATAGNGTTLELEHTAYVDPERWTEFGPDAVGVGWDTGLFGLGSHLASGAGIDPQEAQAWMESPAGLEFITRSSADWCRASVAAGEDPRAARAAAGRTTAAYTGRAPTTEPDAP